MYSAFGSVLRFLSSTATEMFRIVKPYNANVLL